MNDTISGLGSPVVPRAMCWSPSPSMTRRTVRRGRDQMVALLYALCVVRRGQFMVNYITKSRFAKTFFDHEISSKP